MVSIFKRKTTFSLANTGEGWGIFENGNLVRNYTRRRDAVRGATRLGITLENV